MRRRTRRLDIIFLPKIQSDDFALSAGCPRDRCHGGSGAIRRRWRAGKKTFATLFAFSVIFPRGPIPRGSSVAAAPSHAPRYARYAASTPAPRVNVVVTMDSLHATNVDKENRPTARHAHAKPTKPNIAFGGSFAAPSSRSGPGGAPSSSSSGGGGGGGALRQNINAGNVAHGASRGGSGNAPRDSRVPPGLPRDGLGSSPSRHGARGAGVADLNSFRARLNVVKRESMMRQSMMPGMPNVHELAAIEEARAAVNGAHPAPSVPRATNASAMALFHANNANVASSGGASIAEGRPSMAAMNLASSAASRRGNIRESVSMMGFGGPLGGGSFGGPAIQPSIRESTAGGDALFGFGGADPFGAPDRDGAGSVQALNRANFEDPNFVDALERCLHFRPKHMKGFDLKAVKEEARGAINMLKQCLQQALVRKENLVEDLMRAERDRDQSVEGIKLQMESANASAQAYERELDAVKGQLGAARSQTVAVEGELKAAREEAESELRRVRDQADWDARRHDDDFEAKDNEIKSLRARHEATQESLREVRADLAAVRESAARSEREAHALKRDRENGEAAYAAERKALEDQIRAKIDEVTTERANANRARSEFDEKLRGKTAEVDKLSRQLKLLEAQAENIEQGGRKTKAELSSKLASAESELEGVTKEFNREKTRAEETEKGLNEALAAAVARGDELEGSLATVTADAASLKQKLNAAVNGAEDAKIDAEDAIAAKTNEVAKLSAELEKLKGSMAQKEEEIVTKTAEIKTLHDDAEALTNTLNTEREKNEEERKETRAELDKAKLEHAECKGRADSLAEQQEKMLVEVKEARERADKAEEGCRDDVKALEEKIAKEKDEIERKAAEEVKTAKEEAAAEAAAAAAAAEAKATETRAECDARVTEAEGKLAEVKEQSDAMTAELTAALDKAVTDAEEALSTEKAAAAAALAEKDAAAEAAATAAAAEKETLEASIKQLETDLETVNAEKTAASEALQALEMKVAAAAEAMSEAESKHAELIETAQTAEARVQGVVAQLEYERGEVDRLVKEAKEAAARSEKEAKEREKVAKKAAAERADMLSELRALRAATGIGDDGEQVDEEDGDAEGAEMSARDAGALTARLVKATKACAAAELKAAEAAELKAKLKEKQARVDELESQALDADAMRRALHNQIQELRGNVRVFCRVRPTTSETACVDVAADGASVALTKSQGGDKESSVAGFEFDRVFGPSSTQTEVFEEVSQLVQSALDGYKVCLFSYGQTGSGKTHTMLGDQACEKTRGIIPRAVAKVVEASEANAKKGWRYDMTASYVEIYNEQVRDLLCAGSGHSDKHSIVHTPRGVTEVSGVRREPVASVDAAAGLVRRAASARAVEATQMNAVSSRSHTIFMLYITGTHDASGSRLTGCLNLVDLAGSERVGRSGAEGARLKEACAINKSLSCLGDVFQALSNKQSHVPYRNSKLTYLLQPCLGGDGKTLMFVNINPEAPSAEESLCSLKFASQVNAVELGGGRGAKRNITSGMASGANASGGGGGGGGGSSSGKGAEKKGEKNAGKKRAAAGGGAGGGDAAKKKTRTKR